MKKLHGQVRICLSSMDCILWLGVSSLFAFYGRASRLLFSLARESDSSDLDIARSPGFAFCELLTY